MRLTLTNLRKAADQLGHIKAKIADLKNEEDELKEFLKRSEWDTVEGQLFRAVIVDQARTCTNWKGIVEWLDPSARTIRKFTHKTEVTSVKSTARRSEAA